MKKIAKELTGKKVLVRSYDAEDERIRMKLITALKEVGFTHFNEEFTVQEALAWLEEKNKKIKEILLAYTKWLDKRGFFKEDLQCDFPHQIETFLEMKGCENGND